ncbi:acyltransferase family protein [Staphylococcus massiliensis]
MNSIYFRKNENLMNPNQSSNHGQKRYLPGLDGLRAIAVIAIMVYHLNVRWLSGGFVGVDTFFVISGFLITSLLLYEYDASQRIDLKGFWLRRIKRLLPASLFVISSVVLYTVLFDEGHILSIRKDATAAIFYVSNWWYIFRDVDYFNQFELMPLKHLWSLAIEEQFYILFPLIIGLLLKKFKKRHKVILILFGVSIISLIVMMSLKGFGLSLSRLYFGTDTRLQTLLLGVLLAFIWPPFRLKANPPKTLQYTVEGLGIFGLIALIASMFLINDQMPVLYVGGFYILSFITLFIIMSAVHPSTYLSKVLSLPILKYIGQRSYSLYLWHYPIMSVMSSYFVQGQIPWYIYVSEVVLTFACAEVSYRFIETPIRREGFKAFKVHPFNFRRYGRTILSALMIFILTVSVLGGFNSLSKVQADASHNTTFNTNKLEDQIAVPIHFDHIDLTGDKLITQNDTTLAPLLLGDSIMVDIGSYFKGEIPLSEIDGKVGRNLIQAVPLAEKKYASYNKKGKIVVLELGTNGDFSKAQLDSLLEKFNQANVYLVNTRVPRNYETHVNQLLKEASEEHDNVHLVDWYKKSEGHVEYFAYDGIHLEAPGIKALSRAIISELNQTK